MLAIYCQCLREIVKWSTWGVRSQEWNSKELTGARTSGGACGLIRSNAQNLTNPWHVRRETKKLVSSVRPDETQVLHGCRQLVSWDVGLSPATSATPITSYQHVKVGTLVRLPAQAVRKVGTTSSHHGPYAQGCTRATMVGTMGCHLARGSESTKPISVRIVVCNSTTWSRNR